MQVGPPVRHHAGADAAVHHAAGVINPLRQRPPAGRQPGRISPIGGGQPAHPQPPRQGVAHHSRRGEFAPGARQIHQFAKGSPRLLAAQQGIQVAAVPRQQLGARRMFRRQPSQRFGVPQGGKPVAPAPVERGGTRVTEQPVVLLNIAAVKQKIGQQVSVAGLAGAAESPAEHSPGIEHILNPEIRVAGRRRLAGAARRKAVGGVKQRVAIAAVAGGIV